MFHDNVFSVPVTPENIFYLNIRPGCNQLVLPQKPEKAEDYILRGCESTSHGYRTTKKQLSDHVVRYDLMKAGEIAGFKNRVIPKNLRYGSGTAFNKDSKLYCYVFGRWSTNAIFVADTISEGLQNMIMMHSDMAVFVNHYLNRRVGVDTQAIVRGTDSQDEFMKAACRMSRWIDPERPTALTSEQSLSVNNDPELQILVQRRERRRRKHEEHQELQKKIRNRRQHLRKELMASIRKDWDQKAAERDIRLQLSGKTFSNTIKEKLERSNDRTPQHNRLIEAVLSLPGSTIQEEIVRRIAAIRAVVDYCDVQEGDTPRIKRSAASIAPVAHNKDMVLLRAPIERNHEALQVAIDATKRKNGPFVCPDCVGDTKSSVERRTKEYATAASLVRHYREVHLKKTKSGDDITCRVCQLHLRSIDHKRAHAFVVHHIST
jgi:hypothetical protein